MTEAAENGWLKQSQISVVILRKLIMEELDFKVVVYEINIDSYIIGRLRVMMGWGDNPTKGQQQHLSGNIPL
jgi:hypothetical protein